MAPRRPRTNGAERAFQILDCLVGLGVPASPVRIAEILGAPLSTIYGSISLLERRGVLVRRGGAGIFLGPRLHIYGLAFARGVDPFDVYREEAASLSRATGRHVQICLRDGDHMVVADMTTGRDQFSISSRPGYRIPLTWTASGRLLIGHLEPEERRDIFSRAVPSPTGRALTDPAKLERACRLAWRRGVSIQIAESDFAVACIAAPIVDAAGACAAAISLVTPESAARRGGDRLAVLVTASARRIEENLGWRDGRKAAEKGEGNDNAGRRPAGHRAETRFERRRGKCG
ncbi:MAG: IclR family transcriptional regulator [Planctomycetota bacterium]|jgi:DNA-binding IclR family transcriptional regulator|nr:IclR family transcriptional regulator [Planctomycetota bacterium]